VTWAVKSFSKTDLSAGYSLKLAGYRTTAVFDTFIYDDFHYD